MTRSLPNWDFTSLDMRRPTLRKEHFHIIWTSIMLHRLVLAGTGYIRDITPVASCTVTVVKQKSHFRTS